MNRDYCLVISRNISRIMPSMDKTGPQGKGPGTGRGFGKCNPDSKEFLRPCGRGCGRGRGMGRMVREETGETTKE